ncbi:MAG TPA: TPM domain-containing protein [Candidatus Limnocylindrales bacterium]|nr:TPM domain-containing protein [Candidatus Limnocylindrales bacterium]
MRRWLAASLTAVAWLVLVAAPVALALDPPPDHVAGQRVYDPDKLLGDALVPTATQLTDLMADLHDIEVVVVARQRGGTIDDPDGEATTAAQEIVDAWGLDRAVVLYVEAPLPSGCNAGVGLATVGLRPGEMVDPGTVAGSGVRQAQQDCMPGVAAIQALGGVVTEMAGFGPGGGAVEPGAAGPPFPEPEIDRAVYDQAGVFSPETIAQAEATIDAIEARTGAEVVVYSQVVDYGITTDEADAHAQALMDQWGVGRKGFDDGLVILFDLDPSLEHGQVILYGGPGYRAAYLDNAEKQRIFDEDMLPLLRQADMDGALRIALQRVDANATPEHASRLQLARQVDAAAGLIGAPIVLLGLVGSGVFAWLRYGRDPVYLDDPSIHMAGPPRDLTPAAGAFVVNGGPNRRALTAAMLDLASRGEISFREESALLGLQKKVGIEVGPAAADPLEEARRARNGVRPLGPAERLAAAELRALGSGDGYIEPDELLKFGSEVPKFNRALEAEVVRNGWFREKPSSATARWVTRGTIAIVLGVLAFIAGQNLPSAGLTLIAIGLAVGGVVLVIMSRWMQAVTIPGAMIRAMLAAYRRTLEKTMAQARSMDQVVAESGLTWLETPDQAVVWGVALGLDKEVEHVLERSLDDVRAGRTTTSSTYLPVWYGGSGGSAHAFAGGAGGGGGLFSSSGIPDFGGMTAALSTIGNSPSSSGSGGGGFGGGGSGGGGGGSGGGF